MTEHLEGHLAVGAILFVLGAVGFLTRRNLIVMILSAEMMLHGVSINLTAFGRFHQQASGQVFTIFVLTVAACEAGLALSLVLSLYQRRRSLDIALWSQLGEPDLPRISPAEPMLPASVPATTELPRLTPAGPMPDLNVVPTTKV